MNKLTWHRGYPPFTGWWFTKADTLPKCWRWFDANNKTWSISVFETYDDAKIAALYAAKKSRIQHEFIAWTYYWPEGARLPRIDPRKTK